MLAGVESKQSCLLNEAACMNTDKRTDIQSLGGQARAESLTAEQRSEIARKAALSRHFQRSSHEGEFRLADRTIRAVVLPDGKRLIVQANFLRAIGRSRSPKA